eukprot:CAMPEP_0114594586 /NCGR_PEP_ID=MMETSP0125-20121206/16250_1 /TAXON_ID=485358 ORGANISM="Aristerostoma sp., Strain ATCC 50986" /NCGR_SAMPLE_ID=MMETSP0125 /ASSEMBLY_ACC=CAM_ASM_000245 /LENGTH=42 /DNA_ID= /DNA_START= /DNA_END= /DNA_ORIENTATION=
MANVEGCKIPKSMIIREYDLDPEEEKVNEFKKDQFMSLDDMI